MKSDFTTILQRLFHSPYGSILTKIESNYASLPLGRGTGHPQKLGWVEILVTTRFTNRYKFVTIFDTISVSILQRICIDRHRFSYKIVIYSISISASNRHRFYIDFHTFYCNDLFLFFYRIVSIATKNYKEIVTIKCMKIDIESMPIRYRNRYRIYNDFI